MTLVVLQPASNPDAQRHYADTVEHAVSLAVNAPWIPDEDLQALQAIYPSGQVRLWGATPGQDDRNRPIYRRMSVGDLVLFSAHGHVFAGATITHLFENPPLAERLWGRDGKDQTWELMFALDEVRAFDLTYADVNAVLGYKSNNVIQGITVLSEERSAALVDYLGLDSPRFVSAPPVADVVAELAALGGETERAVATLQRREQRILRKSLLPRPTGQCALCGKEYPVAFLVAAHIKKRSQCTAEERLNAAVVCPLARSAATRYSRTAT